jgi:hypothetical protein
MVNYNPHNIPPLDIFLNQINAVHTLAASFLKILFCSFKDNVLWRFQI